MPRKQKNRQRLSKTGLSLRMSLLTADEKRLLPASFAHTSPALTKPPSSSQNHRPAFRNPYGDSGAVLRSLTKSKTPICTLVPDGAPSGMPSRLIWPPHLLPVCRSFPQTSSMMQWSALPAHGFPRCLRMRWLSGSTCRG